MDAFLKFIDYTPKSIGEDYCGVQVVDFRNWKNCSAQLEFSTLNPQHSCFEIIDWNGCVDGELIPLKSDRRKVQLYFTLTWDNIQDCAKNVNDALNSLYGRRVKKSMYRGKSTDISQF